VCTCVCTCVYVCVRVCTCVRSCRVCDRVWCVYVCTCVVYVCVVRGVWQVKLASARYLDNLPTSGDENGRAFRDLQAEAQVLKAGNRHLVCACAWLSA
jgi:hypothetical protein